MIRTIVSLGEQYAHLELRRRYTHAYRQNCRDLCAAWPVSSVLAGGEPFGRFRITIRTVGQTGQQVIRNDASRLDQYSHRLATAATWTSNQNGENGPIPAVGTSGSETQLSRSGAPC